MTQSPPRGRQSPLTRFSPTMEVAPPLLRTAAGTFPPPIYDKKSVWKSFLVSKFNSLPLICLSQEFESCTLCISAIRVGDHDVPACFKIHFFFFCTDKNQELLLQPPPLHLAPRGRLARATHFWVPVEAPNFFSSRRTGLFSWGERSGTTLPCSPVGP